MSPDGWCILASSIVGTEWITLMRNSTFNGDPVVRLTRIDILGPLDKGIQSLSSLERDFVSCWKKPSLTPPRPEGLSDSVSQRGHDGSRRTCCLHIGRA